MNWNEMLETLSAWYELRTCSSPENRGEIIEELKERVGMVEGMLGALEGASRGLVEKYLLRVKGELARVS